MKDYSINPPLCSQILDYKHSMNNKPDLPEGWAMPDDLANQVSEELNKKTIKPDEMLQDGLSDIARDIAIIESDP